MNKNINTQQGYKRSNFIRKLIDSIFGMGLDKLFAAMLPFVAVKLYGASKFGEFTYYFSFAMMFSMVSQLGMKNGLLYFIPKNKNRYISGSFILTILISFLIGLIITLYRQEFIKYIPLFVLLSINALFFSIHRSKQHIRSFYIFNGILRQGTSILLLYLFTLIDISEEILLAYFLGFAFASLILLIYNREHFERPYVDRELFRYSIPLLLSSAMAGIMNDIDSIMIGNTIDNSAVGIYSIGSKIATLPAYMLTILNTVFAPKISELNNEGRVEELKQLYVSTSRVLGVLAVVMLIFIITFDTYILGFFGDDFKVADKVLLYRGTGQVVNSAVGSVWYMLSMTGRSKLNMYGTGGAVIINVILNTMLIPLYGINGAAIASMMAVSFSNVFGYMMVRKYFGVKTFGLF